MKLRKVIVRNFRNLVDVSVPIQDSTVLIGENNSGKTAFLEAIKIVLSGGQISQKNPFDAYDFHMSKVEDSPETCSGIVIELWFNEESLNEWPESLVQPLHDIAQMNPESGLNSIGLRLTCCYDDTTSTFISKREFLNLNGQPLMGRGANQNNQSLFLKYIRLFYLIALRDSEAEFSPRSQFWGRIIRDLKIPAEKQEALREELGKVNADLLSTDPRLEQVCASLENIQKVMTLETGSKTTIQALPLRPWELMSRACISISGSGNQVDFPLRNHGQGIQSLAVLFLFQAYIDVLLKPSFEPETDAILALEEPESHLHPQAIRMLSKYLCEIESQKIISTHSPYFIQEVPFDQIRMFKKSGPATKVLYLKRQLKTILPNIPAIVDYCERNRAIFDYDQGTSTIVVKGKIETNEYRNLLKIYRDNREVVPYLKKLYLESQLLLSDNDIFHLETYVKRMRGDILFARSWLLCEGQSDLLVIQYFAELLGIPLDKGGVSVIDFQNNGSPTAFINLAEVFEIPWIMIFDNDSGGKDFLEQIKKCRISEPVFKDCVRILPGEGTDIERYLINNGFTDDYLAILKDTTNVQNIEYTERITIASKDSSLKLIYKRSGEYEIEKTEQNQDTIIIQSTDSDFTTILHEIIIKEIQKDKVRNSALLVNRLKLTGAHADRVPELLARTIKEIIKKGEEA